MGRRGFIGRLFSWGRWELVWKLSRRKHGEIPNRGRNYLDFRLGAD